MNSSLSELSLPELTSPKLTSSELASLELAWSELPFFRLPSYEFGYPEFNPMSSSLSEPALPRFASPFLAQSDPFYDQQNHLPWWEAAIWECVLYTETSRLPPELTDRIIDFVGGGPDFYITKQRALYRCALVCHGWFPASRYHLYGSTLALQSSKCFEALVQASRIPHVAASLQSVCELVCLDGMPTPKWVHRLPLVLGKVFSTIQELYLNVLEWDAVVMHPDTLSLGFGQFGHVTKLTLCNSKFRNFHQFQCLICALPRLQILITILISVKTCQAFPIVITPLQFPALTKLEFDRSPVLHSALLRWMVLMSASIQSLQLLTTDIYHASPSHLRNFLEHVGAWLQGLYLYDLTVTDLKDLNIDNCTALHTLGLGTVQRTSLAEILGIISPNCHLHKLWISMFPRRVECKWESAARILDEQQFLTLQKFELRVKDAKNFTEEEKRCISDCFDALRRRGVHVVLHFDPSG
ncbi:hypothetical protein BKA93DRAFT_361468 [Sparassis latifolia]